MKYRTASAEPSPRKKRNREASWPRITSRRRPLQTMGSGEVRNTRMNDLQKVISVCVVFTTLRPQSCEHYADGNDLLQIIHPCIPDFAASHRLQWSPSRRDSWP